MLIISFDIGLRPLGQARSHLWGLVYPASPGRRMRAQICWVGLFFACSRQAYAEETRLRNQIEDSSMRLSTAKKVLEELDPNVPFYLQVEWVRSLVALSAVFKAEVQRVLLGPNKRAVQTLYAAALPARVEWYWNNIRVRQAVRRKMS